MKVIRFIVKWFFVFPPFAIVFLLACAVSPKTATQLLRAWILWK